MPSFLIPGLLLPFLGTALGSGCVFFLKDSLNPKVQKSLLGFASGVMVAASVWSLLIPSMDMSESMGRLSFIPAAAGFALGIIFLLLMDRLIPHMHLGGHEEGPKASLGKNAMLVLAVTLHNIPEGMAVGVVLAGALNGSTPITAAGALSLALGIAIQNFPEGAVISLPLKSEGTGKGRAFLYGALSGIVVPFRTSTLFMFVDTGPFPLPLETINYLTGNPSGCNGLSGLAQFRTFIFISLSGTPGFLCGNNKDQVLILGRNSSRTYQHPFQLPVNIYLKIWDSRIGNSLNASRNGIVNHSPYPYVEKD